MRSLVDIPVFDEARQIGNAPDEVRRCAETVLYLDEKRSLQGAFDEADTRFDHYRDMIEVGLSLWIT